MQEGVTIPLGRGKRTSKKSFSLAEALARRGMRGGRNLAAFQGRRESLKTTACRMRTFGRGRPNGMKQRRGGGEGRFRPSQW